MEQWLVSVSEPAIVAIDAIALVVIIVGTVLAVVDCVRLLLARGALTGHERRAVWMRYSHWLVAGLTFQLAADIIESSITPDWDGIGRLAAVAVIRTFLNYFLEHDIAETREREQERARANQAQE
ncbi:MAG TPA: DUF1622 domain-containing protein [Lysobacter sp.]